MKQFGKDFLCKLAIASVLVGIPMWLVIQTNQTDIKQINSQNKITASQNAQELSDYQQSIDKYESLIDAQVKQVDTDTALWETYVSTNDPTVDMSADHMYKLGMSDMLPTPSAQLTDAENEQAYILLSEQSACVNMITQFLQETSRVPQGIKIDRYSLDMCNGH